MSGYPQQYESRSVTQIPSIAPPFPPLFLGNRNRVALTISCNDNTPRNFGFSTNDNPNGSGQFLVVSSPFRITLAFRDYGPLIKQPIYVFAGTAGISITAVEIWAIPQGR